MSDPSPLDNIFAESPAASARDLVSSVPMPDNASRGRDASTRRRQAPARATFYFTFFWQASEAMA
jgi:hypothetical protein